MSDYYFLFLLYLVNGFAVVELLHGYRVENCVESSIFAKLLLVAFWPITTPILVLMMISFNAAIEQ